jgi:ribosomal protein S18 acetylase RimI-like enzyme
MKRFDGVLRSVRVDELDELSLLAGTVYKETFGDEMSDDELESELANRSADYFRECLAHEDVVRVAEDPKDGSLCGFVQFGPMPGSCSYEIRKLYVRRDWQRRGVGSRLLQHSLSSLDARDVQICVWEENVAAVSLYTRFGFQKTSQRKQIIVNGQVEGEDLVLLRQARALVSFKRQSTFVFCLFRCVFL